MILTNPSVVIAAKLVEECGAQATSATGALSSNVNMGVLEKKNPNKQKNISDKPCEHNRSSFVIY